MRNNFIEKDRNILSKETRSELERQVKLLATITSKKYDELENIGILGGLSGLALFQFYCAQYFDKDSYSETGVEILGQCMDYINEGYAFPTYCNGIAGFGWTLQHLVDLGFIDLDLDELLTSLNGYLKDRMEVDFENKRYDLLHGGMGYGLYFLKRYNGSHTSLESKKVYRDFLIRLVDLLEQMAVKEGNGLKWESVLNIEEGNKGYNLSLSHGMCSIIHVLCKIYQSHIEKDRIVRLVKGALNYIKNQEKTNQTGTSLFPSWVDPKQDLDYNSRVAWCYGDIGMAKAFEWGALVLGNHSYVEKSKTILAHTSNRRSLESSRVQDAGFCHGSFGNAHIFYQLGLRHEENLFKEAGIYWCKDGLSRYTSNHEQPYTQWFPGDGKFEFKLNLLEGIAGIGLAMLDFLIGEESNWDECLMLR